MEPRGTLKIKRQVLESEQVKGTKKELSNRYGENQGRAVSQSKGGESIQDDGIIKSLRSIKSEKWPSYLVIQRSLERVISVD